MNLDEKEKQLPILYRYASLGIYFIINSGFFTKRLRF